MTDKSQLNEFKSDDKQSEVPEPIGTGDKKRSADQDNGQKAIPQFATKVEAMNAVVSAFANLKTGEISDYLAGLGKEKNKRPLDKDIKILPKTMTKEDIEAIFSEAEGLTEEVQERIATLFEAAVGLAVKLKETELAEDFENRLIEAVDEIRGELNEAADEYLTRAANHWLEENKAVAQPAIRVEMADNLMTDIRKVFESYSIILPEDIDVVADLTSKLEEANGKATELAAALKEQDETIREYQMAESFLAVAEGLTVTQVDKLEQLAEGINFETAEDYEAKLNVIKETYFDKKAAPASTINEEAGPIVEDVKTPLAPNSAMAGYVSRSRRLAGG